jgi:hypothetical protein
MASGNVKSNDNHHQWQDYWVCLMASGNVKSNDNHHQWQNY